LGSSFLGAAAGAAALPAGAETGADPEEAPMVPTFLRPSAITYFL